MAVTRAPQAVIVGTGFGVFTHLRALRRAGFEVAALVGRDPEKTAQRAALFGVPRACTSLRDALGAGAIDVITIATPPATHCELVLEAAAAGCHILCEKPFALDIAEAQRMCEAVERAGVVNVLGVEFRYSPTHELLRRVVAGGEIGTPRQALFCWLIPLLADPTAEVPGWWMDERAGGGFLGAWGSHQIDQVRITLGEFTDVNGRVMTLGATPGMTADDSFDVQFRLASGVEGVFVHSMGAAGEMFSTVRIIGTEGAAGIDGESVWVSDNKGTKRTVPLPADLIQPPPEPFPHPEIMRTAYEFGHSFGGDLEPYTRLLLAMRERMAGRASGDSPPLASFRDGVAGQAVLDAIRRSARERRWVSIQPLT